MYNVKGLISRFVEDVNEDKDFLFLFLNFDTVLDFNSRLKMCQHLTNWTRWNKLDKFEAAQLYLLSDVFVAVAASKASIFPPFPQKHLILRLTLTQIV